MTYKLMQLIQEELDKIADKGLNTANLDTAYKLIDMLKDMENVEYWKCKEDYYDTVQDAMDESDYSSAARRRNAMGRYSRNRDAYDNNNSAARRGEHYVRGHYSRNDGCNRDSYGVYMDNKQSYRSGKSEESKRQMLASLEEHMDALTEELDEMCRDSDCREERETIERYIQKIKNII